MSYRWKNTKDDPFPRLVPRWQQAAPTVAPIVETLSPDVKFTRLPAMPARFGVRKRSMRVRAGAYATGGLIQPRSM